MSTVSTRKVVRTSHQWTVPAAEPFGANQTEIGKAWRMAQQEFEKVHGRDASYDDDIWFKVGDDEIIVCFETEDPS